MFVESTGRVGLGPLESLIHAVQLHRKPIFGAFAPFYPDNYSRRGAVSYILKTDGVTHVLIF